MNNTRAMAMVGFSVLVGLAAVLLGARWLSQQASVATTKVAVAARDIDLGSALNGSMLEVVSWPAGSVPKGAIGDIKALDSRVVKANMMRGEPILESKLAPVGTKGGLSAIIGSGKRAITVKVNEVIGVAGFALPGNYVDVMVNTQDNADKPISKIVLEKILVLAVAQEASRDETKPKVVSAVTLEVTPEQAERLDLARSVGTLSLALRNQIDQQQTATGGARKSDLLQGRAEPEKAQVAHAPAKPAKRVTRSAPPQAKVASDKIELIRGMQKSSAEI